ncbi:MAG: phenylalanine--tRNA ligase subunit beta [Cytophagales bacterium]
MQISYNWLKQFIDLPYSPEETAALLTSTGLEVESIERFESMKGGLTGLVIGEVLTCEKHPNADKLSKTTVDIGNGIVSPIVCGAPNVAVGQKVVVATVGAILYPTDGESFTIQKAKIRGEVSEGMICAEDEIGMGKSHDGIIVLDTNLPNGTSAATYFKVENDFIIHIGLTPNRVDAASHLGVARDLYAVIGERLGKGIDFKIPDISSFKVGNTTEKVILEIKNKAACPRYAGLVIKNIQVKPSPQWLQNRLKAIGLSPINNIVDATNYVLHDLGQPLHAFDWSKVKGNKIVVKNAVEGELFITLDGKERKLNASDLMICNEMEPMCIAGVFGGQTSGVSSATTSIFLESAYFSPDSIRKTSQLHGLKTDASFRFERGIDPNSTILALKRAALLIIEIAGGEIASEITEFYPTKIENYRFWVDFDYIDRLLGFKLSANKIFSILDALEIGISDETKDGFYCSVPPYRVDVYRPADIVEEIVRIYGFDNLPQSEHLGASYLADFPLMPKEKVENSIANFLAAKGFNEIITNSLTKPEYAESAEHLKADESVEILNKLSPELGVLRQHMLFTGLEAIIFNINRRQKDLKFFEIGKTYRKIGDNTLATGYEEKSILALYITGNTQTESWKSKSDKNTFYDISSAVQQILFSLNIVGYKISEKELSDAVFAQAIQLEKNTKIIAKIGQVKSKFAKMLDIKQTVFYAELDLDYINKLVTNKLQFVEISKFPEVRRDLSLVIDKKVRFEEIQKLAQKTEKKILREMNVFDIYEGDKIDASKKAYAISFTLQDEDQTLNDQQIETTMKRLMQAFEKELGALIRM